MRNTGPSQLYTCRYWALGSGCPNQDATGVNLCLFAHWDTGRLASNFDQRGTCRFWLRGNCRHGDKCFYEHRNTGVDAMWQGPISLTGLNLEIANAAARGGFNTWNQDALYHLIWSVKRVALRHCRPQADRPRPKDPLYPDRFRPSGLGDNSHKKRKLQPEPKLENSVSLADRIQPARSERKPYRYHNIENRARARPLTAGVTAGVTAGIAGTQEDPIDIMSDGEDDRSKRQKLNNGNSQASRPQANQSRLRADAPSFRSTTNIRTSPVRRMVTGGSFTQQDDFVSFTQGESSTGYRTTSQNLRELIETPLDSLSNALVMVPRNLREIANLTQTCTEKMRAAFDDYQGSLSADDVFPSLVALNANFEAIKGELKLGMDGFEYVKNKIQRFKRENVEANVS